MVEAVQHQAFAYNQSFLGLLFGDPGSLWPLWTPKTGTDFGLKDFVRYARGSGGTL
jgi:hypothetical protein